MNKAVQFFLSKAKADPSIANNPMAQSFIEVIETGDAKRGQEIANNILESYGTTKEQAIPKARQFFNI